MRYSCLHSHPDPTEAELASVRGSRAPLRSRAVRRMLLVYLLGS